jgi:hypothetical protein
MSSEDPSAPPVGGAGSGDGKEASISALEAATAFSGPQLVPDMPLTAEQEAKLASLRSRAAGVPVGAHDLPYWRSDGALTRFLNARAWDVDKALKQYTGAMEFRASRSCGTMLGTYTEPLAMRHYFTFGFVGRDKQGFTVLVERVGRVDLIGMTKAVKIEDFLSWVCFYHEKQEVLMARASAVASAAQPPGARPLERHKMTVIIDMAGLSLSHISSATLAVLKQRTRLEEDK